MTAKIVCWCYRLRCRCCRRWRLCCCRGVRRWCWCGDIVDVGDGETTVGGGVVGDVVGGVVGGVGVVCGVDVVVCDGGVTVGVASGTATIVGVGGVVVVVVVAGVAVVVMVSVWLVWLCMGLVGPLVCTRRRHRCDSRWRPRCVHNCRSAGTGGGVVDGGVRVGTTVHGVRECRL